MTREKGEQNGRKARRFSFFAASCGYVALSSLELKNSQFSVSFSLLGRKNSKHNQEMKRRKKRERESELELGAIRAVAAAAIRVGAVAGELDFDLLQFNNHF